MKKVFIILILLSFPVYFLVTMLLNIKTRESKQSGSSIPAISIFCSYKETLKFSTYSVKEDIWEPNNKFGIYVYAENADFFELAQNLVNSNDGEWGYVLIPFNVRDEDKEKWGRVFAQLQAKKLIPIVQLWDINVDDYKDQTRDAAEFLNSFIWPVKPRYIAAYNEPNDSSFWYGKVDPEMYAKVLDYTVDAFKEVNPDFFIMNAGFNTSAPSDGKHMDAFEYMKKMNEKVPGIFEKLDGWASHSYPQPNFAGNPHNTGRWSIKAYETELDFLKRVLKVNKDLPIFITETGWAHAEGEEYNNTYLPVDKVAEHYETAYKEVWLPDDRVRAVIAFTLWYPAPHDHFAWVNVDKVPYKHYEEIKKMRKVKGRPPSLTQKEVIINVCDEQ